MHVLICTLFRDSEFYLDKFLGSLNKLIDYSIKKGYDVELCFLEGNSADNTWQRLIDWQKTCGCKSALYQKDDIDLKMSRYKRLAILRNAMIALGSFSVDENYNYIMMIDSDMCFKEDLLERLIVSLESTDGIMIAPMNYVENTDYFHDILAFAKDGTNFVNNFPYHAALENLKPENWGTIEMDSVGDCFLVKADALNCVRFKSSGESEQIGFCRNVRKKGKIYLDTRISVYHADLPKHGLSWH